MTVESHFRLEGGGGRTPLVLVHGVGLDLEMWGAVLGRLSADRLVVRYDLLGHGGTPDPSGDRTIEDFVAQLLDLVDDLGIGPPDLAGLSLGGMVALAAAARHPEAFRRLALLNTVFDRTPAQVAAARDRLALTEAEGMAPVADLAIDRWFTADWQAANPDEAGAVRERLLANDVDAYLKAYRVFVEGDPLMPEGAALVTAPTLAMTGELDPGSTPGMSRALAAALPAGQALVLPGLHHLPPIEAPDEFVGPLLHFLDEEQP